MKQLIKPENLQYLFREKKNNGAEFTVKSVVTGKDYTFKVSRSKFQENWYTHVYVEQGYQHFARLGVYRNGAILHKGREVETPSAQAIAWVFRQINNNRIDKLNSVEVMHTGSCLVCGKKLTDADSIEHGIGPVCRNR